MSRCGSGARVGPDELGSDEVILATGSPRASQTSWASTTRRWSVISTSCATTSRSAGARRDHGRRRIGFDVAEYLTQSGPSATVEADRSTRSGASTRPTATAAGSSNLPENCPRGDLCSSAKRPRSVKAREDHRLDPPHRTEEARVRMVPGVTYERIDDAGLHVNVDGTAQVLDVETIVVCRTGTAAHCSRNLSPPAFPCRSSGAPDVAAELDAKRAISRATEVAAAL